jgi:hypothetical protein
VSFDKEGMTMRIEIEVSEQVAEALDKLATKVAPLGALPKRTAALACAIDLGLQLAEEEPARLRLKRG